MAQCYASLELMSLVIIHFFVMVQRIEPRAELIKCFIQFFLLKRMLE